MKIDKDKLAVIAGFTVILIISIGIVNIDRFFETPDVDVNAIASIDKASVNIANVDYGTNPDAKVTVVEYSDFECPYCARGALTMKKIKVDYGDKVNLVFKHFPVHGQSAVLAAAASECARDQGKFWEYHYLLFENQYKFSKSQLKGYASEQGLDTEKFESCLDSGEKNPVVLTDMGEGQSNGVGGTPTFFVNDKKIVGAQDYSVFKQAIDEALAGE